MAKEQVNYRLVLEADKAQSTSEPAPLGDALAAFNDLVAKGGFRPSSGRRLLVLSEEAWASRRRLTTTARAMKPEAA